MLLLLLSHFSHARLCATPKMAAPQAPPSLGSGWRRVYGEQGIRNVLAHVCLQWVFGPTDPSYGSFPSS